MPQIDIFDQAESMGYGSFSLHTDPSVGLKAIIAIHSTELGPAVGGCRCLPYHNTISAIQDALLLGKGMSYKAAMHNLPHGGGKAVIIKPRKIVDKEKFYKSFAQFVDSFNGRYITAIDAGTTPEDMDIINQHTPHVLATSHQPDVSFSTALGVYSAMLAATEFKFNSSLKNKKILIQGVGSVGSILCKLLHEAGAQLMISDINPNLLEKISSQYQAKIIPPAQVYTTASDIFSPCGLGGVITETTVNNLKTKIICGAANNQAESTTALKKLSEYGVIYIPDYLVNAGGLINVALRRACASIEFMQSRVLGIGNLTTDILKQANQAKRLPVEITDEIVAAKIQHTSLNAKELIKDFHD